MNLLDKLKIENAICFFANEHKKRTKRDLPQTALYKYLAFLDFWSLENTGKPALGLTYKAMQRGPVPVELYNNISSYSSELFIAKPGAPGTNSIFIIPKKQPDLDEFSGNELRQMRILIETYAEPWITTAHISDASHERLLAWQRAFAEQPNSVIDLKLHFPGDIEAKKQEDLTPEEDSFIVYKALSGLHGNL
jgi:uncharacterized phage-associated protein